MPDAAIRTDPARQAEISARQFTALDQLRREIEPRAAVPDPLTLADHEDTLSSWLSSHGAWVTG